MESKVSEIQDYVAAFYRNSVRIWALVRPVLDSPRGKDFPMGMYVEDGPVGSAQIDMVYDVDPQAAEWAIQGRKLDGYVSHSPNPYYMQYIYQRIGSAITARKAMSLPNRSPETYESRFHCDAPGLERVRVWRRPLSNIATRMPEIPKPIWLHGDW